MQRLKGLTPHNDIDTLQQDVSLLLLFTVLNELKQTKNEKYKNDAYVIVYSNNKLTVKA